MKVSLPLLAGLVLVASGCAAAGGGEPTARGPTFVRELEVESDYGQLYIYDSQALVDDSDWTEDDNPLSRALEDGYRDRRFVGYDGGLVDVQLPSQYNWKLPMRIEVSDDEPPLELDGWDHVVEVALPVPSGILTFEASGGAIPRLTEIPKGIYRARISGRGFVSGAGEIEGHERYRLQLWPAPESKPKLIKYWNGYDVMR
jgi:hypothetical protein